MTSLVMVIVFCRCFVMPNPGLVDTHLTVVKEIEDFTYNRQGGCSAMGNNFVFVCFCNSKLMNQCYRADNQRLTETLT